MFANYTKEERVNIDNFSLLFVEDNEELQDVMKIVLEDSVKIFYQAFNGKEGLEIFREKNPDIVITDINMPILDGLSMSREIKKLDKCKPIIILSAFDDKETLLEAVNIGIDSFIPKPIDTDFLFDKLKVVAKSLQDRLDADKARREEMKKLHELAHYDTLTEIPNRLSFDVTLSKAIERAKKRGGEVALFFIDLDNFKDINDIYGHAMGDIVLKSVANNIKKIIRSEDTVARIGGDEFALIVESCTDDDYIENLAKRILSAISGEMKLGNDTVKISCSIGISRCPNDAKTKESLIDLSDKAMYMAKKLGKNKYLNYKDLKFK